MSEIDRSSSGANICDFWKGNRSCPDEAVATVTMPPRAPERTRRACADHARRLEAVGDPVTWDEGLDWIVFDFTTMNQLGEFATESEARAYVNKIRPLGRYGPDGHDLRVMREAEL